MQSILEQITDWLKSMIISGIMGNLSGMFDSVNQQVGQIAGDVGTTPANFSPAVFSMIRNISESVILPIAGMVLTFIACYELIQIQRFKTVCGMSGDLSCSLTWSLTKFF